MKQEPRASLVRRGKRFPPRRLDARSIEDRIMRMFGLALSTLVVIAVGQVMAEDPIKSGPDKKIAGPFDVKAITGDNKGKTLCYV